MVIKCPVCGTVYENKVTICTTFRFTELNKVFISQEDYQKWIEDVVKPFLEMYQREHKEKEELEEKQRKLQKELQYKEDMYQKECTEKKELEEELQLQYKQQRKAEKMFDENKNTEEKDLKEKQETLKKESKMLRSGTVVATGDNEYGQCDVKDWTDIVSIVCGDYNHTVGLRKNGTVVATGIYKVPKSKVKDWKGITYIACSNVHIVGLTVQ